MPTVDLAAPATPPTGMLEGLPRRLALTLPELRLLAERWLVSALASRPPVLPVELVTPTVIGSPSTCGRSSRPRLLVPGSSVVPSTIRRPRQCSACSTSRSCSRVPYP